MQKLLKKFDKVTKYLVAAILVVVPIYPKFPFIDIPKTHVFIRLEDFLMLVGAIYLAFFFLKDAKSFLKNKVNYSVLLFLFVGFISLISAIFVTKTVYPTLGLLHWLRRVEYLIPLFLATTVFVDTKKKLKFYLNLIVLTLLMVFIYGVGQKYFSWPVIATQNEEIAGGIAQRWNPGSHLYSTFAGHYDLASYLVLLLPVIISYFYLVKDKVLKIVVGFSFLGGLWLLANSLSRISIVSYLGAMTISLVLIKKYKEVLIVGLISLAVFGFSSNLLDRYSRIFRVTKEKIQERVEIQDNVVFAQEETSTIQRKENSITRPTPIPIFEDRSTSIRLNVEWPRALRSFYKNPLLGTGYSSITLATDNDYLRLLGEVGIIGFLAFFLFLTRIFSKGILAFPLAKNFKGESLALMAGLSGAIPGVLLNALFIDIFEASKFAVVFWLMIGLGLSVVNNEKN
jgi:hypothetical protein